MIKHILILILAFCIITPIVSADPVSTTSASVNSTGFGCVVFTGVSDGTLPHVWFEYGATSNINDAGNWYSSMRTKSQTVTGTFTARVCGAPFLPGKPYSVRAAGGSGNLSDTITISTPQNFTMPTITPIPTTTYIVYSDAFFDAADNQDFGGAFTTVLESVFTDNLAGLELLFFGIIFGLIFMNIGIKQDSVIMPLLLLIAVGSMLSGLLPAELFVIIEAFAIVAFAGTAYWIYKRRK